MSNTIKRVFFRVDGVRQYNTEIQLNNRQGRSSTFNLNEFRFNSFTPTLNVNTTLFCKGRWLL